MEERKMEWDEMTQKRLTLPPTLSGWYQTCFNTMTGIMLEKNGKLRTGLAEREAKVKRMKKLAREDDDYYHQRQARLSNLEGEKRIWDSERKWEEEDKAASVFKFQPSATQTETVVGQHKGS